MSLPPLQPEESFATGMVRPRTTALFFDKLWVHPILIGSGLVPAELCISNPLGSRLYYLSYAANGGFLVGWIEKQPNWDNYLIPDLEVASPHSERHLPSFTSDFLEDFRYREDHDPQPTSYRDADFYGRTTKHRNKAINDIVKLYNEKNIKLIPIYLNPTEYDEVSAPQTSGLEICIDFIPVILDAELTWEQVLEFRKDKKAREKLIRLRRWFSIDLLSKNGEEIKSILGKRLDDYEWALKKHGIQTVIGGLTSILSFIAAPTAFQLLTQSPLASALSGVAIGSGAIAWITNKTIERMETHRDEVAYIYEVRKLIT